MKKRGFTLVELLAVIVILAVIALIATPTALNLITDARKNAAKDSAYGYVRAVENSVIKAALQGKTYQDKEDYSYGEIEVELKGTRPSSGIYSLSGGKVVTGTFCINDFVVNYQNDLVEVSDEKCKAEDLKLMGNIKLSSYSDNYTYPNSGSFEIIENISGGATSCISSDEAVATCTINGKIVTVTPGKKEGSTTLTVISAETSKYKQAQAAYVAVTAKGLLTYTANGYTGTYDGKAHGIIVSSENSIIKYGAEANECNFESSPKYTDAGEYIVYYEITREGYQTVTGSKNIVISKAEGKIELEKISGTLKYNETDNINIVNNISGGKISVVSLNDEVVEATIVDGTIVIKGKKTGTAQVQLTSDETTNYKSTTTNYSVTVGKANNTLTLSSNTGNYTYPEKQTIEITENKSGGTISCTSDNENVATCSVKDNETITVTPGTTEGSATLTIKSAATDNYNEGQVAYVAVTAKGLLTYTANGYTGTYDGKAHGITVTSSGATIKYGETSGAYNLTTSPTLTNVGTKTVYYQITRAGYQTVTGDKTITINKAEGNVTAPTAKTLTYTGSSQALINAGSSTTGTIQYKIGSSGTYSANIPTATAAGTYDVYYKVVGNSNYNDVAEKGPIKVTISKAQLSVTANGYTGTYDGKAHGITVTSSGATIKYGETSGTYNLTTSPTLTNVGTKTVYYQITREGYQTVTGNKTITINKANNTLTLSANTGTYTYPTAGTFTVTTNTSGGTLSCTSGNTSVATCSVSGSTITVTPGTTAGSATLTIKSAATTNYNEAQVSHVAATSLATLSVTANGYTGTYDGKAHGITVTSSGATIKYGETSGTYNLTTSPTLTNVGTKTVYYQVTKTGYKTVTGSKTITITKAAGTATLSSTSGTINAGNSTKITVSNATGTLSCTPSNSSVATCSVSGTTVTVNGVSAGTATITINVATSTNYNATSKSYSVTVKALEYAVSSKTYTEGESVTWAGLDWYVIKDNSNSVTMILKGNYTTGAFGTSNTFLGSTAYTSLNTNFVNANSEVKAAITEGSVVSQGTYNSAAYYVRLPEQTELSTSIPNDSATSFWTQTVNSTGLYFGNSSGAQGNVYTVGTTSSYRGITAQCYNSSSCPTCPTQCSNSNLSKSLATTLNSTSYINSTVTSVIDSYTSASEYSSSKVANSGAGCLTVKVCDKTGAKDTYTCNDSYRLYASSSGCTAKTVYTLGSATNLGYRPVVTVYKK